MALADDLRALRDNTLTDLRAAHNYYADTRIAWTIASRVVQAGYRFTKRNPVTDTATTQTTLTGKAPGYVAEQLGEATFQQFLSIFEGYFFDLLRLWLLAYPQSLMAKKVDFKTVFDAPDKDTITLSVVNRELNEVLYERPAGWFAYLEERARLGCPTAEEIERFAEAKACRDALIHNRGIAGAAYESKAGRLAQYGPGERIAIPVPYHRQTWQLLCKLVADIASAAAAKVT